MSEINLPCSFIFLYRPSIESEFDQRSLRFHTNADQKRLSLAPRQRRQFSSQCANFLTAVMKRGGEAKRRKVGETRERQQRDVDAQMRRGGERGKKDKKREEEKKERRVRRSGSRRIKGPLVLFNLAGIYLSRTCTHNARRCLKVLSASASLSLSLDTRAADKIFYRIIRFDETRKEVT